MEKEYNEYEILCQQNEILEQHLEEIEMKEAEEAHIVAQYKEQRELQALRIKEAIQARREEETKLLLQAENEKIQKVIEEAKKARASMSKLLQESQKKFYEKKREEQRTKEAEEEKLMQSKANLARSIEKAKASILSMNERIRKKNMKRDLQEQEEMENIRYNGGNPYLVIRERKEKTKLEKILNTQYKKEIEEQEKVKKMLDEEKRIENLRKTKLKLQKQIEQEFMESTSNKAMEKKMSDYIQSVTINRVPMVDPLGRQHHLFPSKVMNVKNWKFGLGKTFQTNPSMFEKIRKKYPKAEPDPLFMKRASSAPAARRRKIIEKKPKEDGFESDEELAEPEFTGTWKEEEEITKDDEKTLIVSKGTVLEQFYLAQAKKRHRENLTTKQIVWGKEFKGVAFISEPKIIQFIDYELGKSYKTKVVLTNVSFTFNTFKVLPLKDEIKDFFEISYKLPGKMSAGTTCTLYIKFTPRVLMDIHEELPILAQTGKFGIPLQCLTKKVVITVHPAKVIDFGPVVFAESSTVTLKISNSGALDTSFKIIGEAVEKYSRMTVPQSVEEDAKVLTFSSKMGYLEHHSSTSIKITYRPHSIGQFSTKLKLQFTDDFTDDIELDLIGEGRDVPIYLESPILDLKCCYFETLYRDSLIINNRGKISMKCEVEIPPELKGHLEYNPRVGFVQPGIPFMVQVKFRPKKSIIEQAKKYCKPNGELEIPIRVFVPDQVMPIYYTLKAHVTPSELIIEPNFIDFGKVSTEESISVPVTITNQSILPQKFGFVKLPPEFEVTPFGGFGEILPKEQLHFNVIFSPKAAIEYHVKLICKTTRNEEFIISCKAKGVQPPLKFSAPLIKLASTAIGDFVTETVQIINVTKREQSFQLVEPEDSGLTLLPLSGKIPPKGSASILIRFCISKDKFVTPELPKKEIVEEIHEEPKKEDIEKTKEEPKKQKTKSKSRPTSSETVKTESEIIQQTEQPKIETPELPKKEMIDAGWEESRQNEPWSRHRNILIPCFIPSYELKCTFLQIDVTVVQGTLIIECDGKQTDVLDFGKVCLNQKITKTIQIRNASGVHTKLSFDPIGEHGPFMVIKPPKPLDDGQTCEMAIQFSPKTAKTFAQTLQITSTHTNKGTIQLKGIGLLPSYSIEPMDDFIHLGDVCVNESTIQNITIQNLSEFEVPFNVEIPEDQMHPWNRYGTKAIYVEPSNGFVNPKEKQIIKLVFVPDHEFSFYKANVIIKIGGHEKIYKVRGRGWNEGAFVVFEGEEKRILEKTQEVIPQIKKQEEVFDDLFETIDTIKTTKTYEYSFLNVHVNEKRIFTFDIGCTKMKGKAEFSFEDLGEDDKLNGFAIEPIKGTIDPGSKKQITISFTPSEKTLNQLPVKGIDFFVEMRKKCTLKDAHKTVIFNLVVRGQVKV